MPFKQWTPRSCIVVLAMLGMGGLAVIAPEVRRDVAIALTASITGYFAAEQPGDRKDD